MHLAPLTAADEGPLELHNAYRAVHRAPALTWDEGLASYAQALADYQANQCQFYHPNTGYGENLAVGMCLFGLDCVAVTE